eukprot:8409230-Heterocapsa_arctica.AAC.1
MAFRGFSYERAFEAQHCPLNFRICCKPSVFCEEFDGDSEDIWIRKCECLTRAKDCKQNK